MSIPVVWRENDFDKFLQQHRLAQSSDMTESLHANYRPNNQSRTGTKFISKSTAFEGPQGSLLRMELPPAKKPKPLPTVPLIPEGWDRCHAYLDRKGRFCRQEILPSLAAVGSFYCGNHRHLCSSLPTVATLHQDGTTIHDDGRNRKRIPCPIDPTHHIYDDMVEKHIEKCPKTIELRSQQQQSFYCRNCNCGGHGRLNKTLMRSQNNKMNLKDEDNEFDWAKRVAISVLETYQRLFSVASEIETDVTQLTINDIMNSIQLHDLSKQEFDAGFLSAVSDYRIKSGGIRHMHQQASLIGHLRRIGVLERLDHTNLIPEGTEKVMNGDKVDDESTVTRIILEMGAGRGMTGLVVAGVSAMNKAVSTYFTMIERSASRSRAEKFLRKVKQFENSFPSNSNYLNLSTVQWNRIQCDLSHVDIKAVLLPNLTMDLTGSDDTSSGVSRNELVVVAKHLCGVGTDLALKSLEPIKDNVTACIMSTCCHGVCDWNDYVGRDYLLDAILHATSLLPSFGEEEFDLLRLWSSGTVRDIKIDATKNIERNQLGDDNEHNEHNEMTEIHIERPDEAVRGRNFNSTNVTKIVEGLKLKCGAQGLGRACQRLIDYGRCEYLRHVIFSNSNSRTVNVELKYYVPDSITPQNAVLIAYIDNP
jgi:tRNA:m4X modification enzyme